MAKKEIHNEYSMLDYSALKTSGLDHIVAGAVEDSVARFDSADDAAVFFARELDHVKAKTYDRKYPKLTALAVFPRTSEIDAGAETMTYYSYDKTGVAKIISNYATDLPRADVQGKPTTVQIKSLGDSYGYSVQEMRASRLAGKSLDARKGEAARSLIENLTNKIAWAGDNDTGLIGVLSTENDIPVYTAANNKNGTSTKFKDKTPDEILAEISDWYQYVAKLTSDVEVPDTLCVPPDVYIYLSTTRLPSTDTTIKKFLLENLTELKDIVRAPELADNATETNPYAKDGQNVAFLFTNDEEKLALEVPLDFTQYPVQVKGLESIINCEQRVAGVIVYYPFSALIIPGI